MAGRLGRPPKRNSTLLVRTRTRRPQFGVRKRTFGSALVFATLAQAALIGPAVRAAPATSPGSPGPEPTSTPAAPGIVIAAAKFDLPDPFLLATGGIAYLYVSTAFADPTQNVPLLVGRPGHWRPPRDALPSLPSWAVPANQGGLTWAPEVHRFGATYVLYFSSTLQSNRMQHCIGAATSGSPTGLFTALPQPFICDTSQGGDIDAQVFVDRSGSGDPGDPYYLIWKSDNNSTPGDGVPAIWARPLSADGLHLLGRPIRIYGPEHPSWQAKLVEAPQMITSRDGRVWLFYSAGTGFDHSNYAMGAASCAGPLGPCSDVSSGPLIRSNDQGAGPGEETAFSAPDGTTWLLYNPWSTRVNYRWVRPAEAIRINWSAAGPYVGEAGTFPPL
jgi:Glycosyl hydrolases family 43